MQDLEWQMVGYVESADRGIGVVEANWRNRRRESGDVGFMVKLWSCGVIEK